MSRATSRADLPTRAQSRLLADWLRGPRARALRWAAIGLRHRVLEVGSGHGVVTAELQQRARGAVTCLDLDDQALSSPDYHPHTPCVAGDCRALPFADASFDLVFFQNVLLWVAPPSAAIAEAARVLTAGGVLVAVEPDYGGMMEHPELGLRELWMAGLRAAGADPVVGRKLPALCEAVGLRVWVELSHLPQSAEPEALELLADLPLPATAEGVIAHARTVWQQRTGAWTPFIHLPYFLIVAERG